MSVSYTHLDVYKRQDLKNSKHKGPLYAAIDNYHGRIENLILSQENKLIQKDWEQLKLLILSIESDGLEQAYEEGKMRERGYRVYQRYLHNMEQRVNRNLSYRLTYYLSLIHIFEKLRTSRNNRQKSRTRRDRKLW